MYFIFEFIPVACINVIEAGQQLQVVDGKLTAGQLSSFVIYALYVGTNVGSLASVISNLIQVSSFTGSSHSCKFSV